MVPRLCDDGVQGRDGRCVENNSCFQIFLFVSVCILLLGSLAGLIWQDNWCDSLVRLPDKLFNVKVEQLVLGPERQPAPECQPAAISPRFSVSLRTACSDPLYLRTLHHLLLHLGVPVVGVVIAHIFVLKEGRQQVKLYPFHLPAEKYWKRTLDQ